MANEGEDVPPDLLSLVNNVGPTDVTSILKFVEHGKLPNDRISEKYMEYVSDNIQFMELWLESECFQHLSDLNIYETLHCYFKLQKFKTNLTKLEDHLKRKMTDIGSETGCPTCSGRICLNPAKTLFENLSEHELCEKILKHNNSKLIESNISAKPKIAKLIDVDDDVKPIKKYDEVFAKKFYPKQMMDYIGSVEANDVCVFSTRVKDDALLTCLVCECVVSSRTYVISDHVKGHRHQNNLKDKLNSLLCYHDSWMDVPAEHQHLQTNYLPADENHAKCTSCKRAIHNTEFVEHVQDHESVVRIMAAIDANDPQWDVKNNYEIEVENKLYPRALIEYVRGIDESAAFTVRLKNRLIITCLLCDCEFSAKNLFDMITHVRGRRHKLISRSDAGALILNTYHNYWAAVGPKELQLMQVDFVPLDDASVRCISYKKTMLYSELREHLQERVAALALNSQTPTANTATNDCKKSIDKYDADVEEKLYPKLLVTKVQEIERVCSRDKSIFTVRLVNDERLHCILCNCSFLLKNLPTCFQHVKGHRHLKNLSNPAALRAYHENWMAMDASYQAKQLDFLPATIEHTKCQKCGHLVLYSELAMHLNECETSTLTDGVSALCQYDAATAETIYKGLTNYSITVQGTTYPIIQRLGSMHYCILCGLKINQGHLRHVKSELHAEHMAPKYYDKVKQFHCVWLSQSPEMQRQQVLFRKRSDKITCTVCSNFVPYNKILLKEHLESSQHKSFSEASLNHSASSSSIASGSSNNFKAGTHEVNDESISGVNSEYGSPKRAVTVIDLALPESLAILETLIKEMDESPTGKVNSALAQKKNVIARMIVLQEKLESAGYKFIDSSRTGKPKDVSSETDAPCDTKNECPLSANPSITDDSDSSADDEPRDAPLPMVYSPSELPNQQPVNYNENDRSSSDSRKGNSSNSTPTDGEQENSSLMDKQNNEQFSKSGEDDSDSDSVASFRDSSKSDSFKSTSSRQAGDPVEETVPSDDRKNAFQFKFDMRYDQQVEERYYPGNLSKYFVRLDNVKYPIFRVYREDIVCMICKKYPAVTSVKDHVGTERHCSRMRPHSLSKLKKFHNFWMNQEVAVQLEQKNFKCLGNKFKCYLCDAVLAYEEVIEHIRSAMHEKFSRKPLNRNKNENDAETQEDALESTPVSNVAEDAKPGTSTGAKKPPNEPAHNIRKSIPDPKSANIFERLPLRLAEHLTLLVDNQDSVTCTSCNVTLQHEAFNIRKHLCAKNHLATSKVPLNKYKYYCEICIKFFSVEETWEKHLKNEEHVLRLSNLSKQRSDNIVEHECLTCLMVIYGDSLSLRRHQQLKGQSVRKSKDKVVTLPEGVRRLFESEEKLELVASTLLLEANGESQNLQRERDCCLAFVKVLKKNFPTCEAYPFGSRVTGLGNKESDLDVFLDVGNMYNGGRCQERLQQFAIVKQVAKELRKYKDSFSHINAVPWARTPIIQVYNITTDIDCDVSFRHGLSVENTAFIRLCVDLQPILQKVILILKKWSACCSTTSNLSSYALTMMIIFYLQGQGYLLSIKQLREINPKQSRVIDGWETIKYTATLQTMRDCVRHCEYKTKELLIKFFSYYTTFDSNSQVICPLLGYSISKTAFDNNGAGLPQEMCNYVRKLEDPSAELFRNLSPLCVQDPFDLSHNLTKAINEDYVKKIKTLFDLSEKHLSALT